MEGLEKILLGCKNQNLVSQEKLYRQFYPGLFSLCSNFFDDKHEIITAINNGMLNVFSKINQFDETKGLLFNWAYTIVRNAALTMLRDKKKVYDVELLKIHDVQNDPFNKNNSEEIFNYLNVLPVTTRSICSLFYVEDFSIKEIAILLAAKEGTIKWHLNEGRTRLKTLLSVNFKFLKSAG